MKRFVVKTKALKTWGAKTRNKNMSFLEQLKRNFASALTSDIKGEKFFICIAHVEGRVIHS